MACSVNERRSRVERRGRGMTRVDGRQKMERAALVFPGGPLTFREATEELAPQARLELATR
jgi:hypothetical protein